MTFSDISVADILSDPVNYVTALIIFLLLWLFMKYAYPRIVKGFLEMRNSLDNRIVNVAIFVLKAAEQARKKGDANAWLAAFGIEIDLSDNDAIREAVVQRIQQELNLRFSWGKLINTERIAEIVLALLREDQHKGATHPLEALAEVEGPAGLLQYVPVDTIKAAAEMADQLAKGKTPQLAIANGPLPDPRVSAPGKRNRPRGR